jgi:hypothetical protein
MEAEEVANVDDNERPSWWRSATPPHDWDGVGRRRRGRVRLPEHLCWSGPKSEFDLGDTAELRFVYATVLREGSEADVREWINPRTLVEIWDSLWLPQAVHEAWDDWIAEHRVHATV